MAKYHGGAAQEPAYAARASEGSVAAFNRASASHGALGADMAHQIRSSECETRRTSRAFVSYFVNTSNGLTLTLRRRASRRNLAEFPGEFAPPVGELLLARSSAGRELSCVGLRPLEISGTCEVKRLYLRAPARGTGVGCSLARSIAEIADALGYRQAMLDALPTMRSAIAIYRKLGFAPMPPYWSNLPGILCFAKQLSS